MRRTRHLATVFRLQAVIAGWVSLDQMSFRKPVVTEQQVIPAGRQMPADQIGLNPDVLRFVKKSGQDCEGEIGRQHLLDGLDGCLPGGIGVLGVEGDQQHIPHAGVPQPVDRAGDGRLAIPHGKLYRRIAQHFIQRRLECMAVMQQRRTRSGSGSVPDLAVGSGAAPGSKREDDAPQQQLAYRPGQVDHVGIVEELGQITAHVRDCWRIGSAKIDQKNTSRHETDYRRWLWQPVGIVSALFFEVTQAEA